MPSLREKVTTYFRQLSFIAEPREGNGSTSGRSRKSNDGNFITKYLEGRMDNTFVPGPDIKNGQAPNDLPDLTLSFYPTGPNTITAACTGPDDGLTGIKRSKLHLSAGSDIDFIDTNQDQEFEIRRSTSNSRQQLQKNLNCTNNTTMTISSTTVTGTTGTSTTTTSTTSTAITATVRYRSDQNANKTNIVRTRKNTRSGGGGGGGVNLGTDSSSINNCAITDNNKRMIVNSSDSQKSNSHHEDNQQQQQNKQILKQQQKLKTDVHHHNNESSSTTENQRQQQQQQCLELITNNCKDNHFDIEKDNEKSKTTLIEQSIAQVVTHKQQDNQQLNQQKQFDMSSTSNDEPIAGVTNWKMETDHAYGISISLYEYNMITKESMGNPIADCYGLVVRGNCAAMALADGVNWGEGARLAARSAVHGSLDYLDTAIFGVAQECKATSTRDVFISLLRSFWEAHDCILEVGGALSTLTVAVVLPLGAQNTGKYVVCACNVGDSLGYIYSKYHGVREFTQGSHDITSMRDMRDALGALGPADGNKPELGNLTLSMTIVDSGDIVFLTSDGVSDNFDPVVGKFAEAWTPNSRIKIQDNQHSQLAPKRQNKSASALYNRSSKENKPSTEAITKQQKSSHSNNLTTVTTNAIPVRPPRNKNVQGNSSNVQITERSSALATTSTGTGTVVNSGNSNRPKYMRSHTVIEPRGCSGIRNQVKFPRSAAGLPLVTGPQRHALTLLRLEDLLSYGINGSLKPCPSARKLCHLVVDFVKMITSARRKTLEQRELFYKLVTDQDGCRREIELNRMQHKSTRKRIVDSSAFSSLPGKLDHATIVAFTVGSGLQTTEFKETNF